MPKTYKYYRFERYSHYDVLIFFLLAALFLNGFAIPYSQSVFAFLKLPAWIHSIADLILFLSLGLGCYYFLHNSGVKQISLDDHHLICHIPRQTIHLAYQDIEKVKSRLAFGGGWFLITSQNHKFRIGINLQNMSDFIRNLKNHLDQQNLADRYQTQNMFKALVNAVYSEHIYTRFKYHFLVSALIITTNIFLSEYFANFSDHFHPNTRLVFKTSMFWQLIPYTISEIILYHHTARQTDLASFTCPPPTPQFQKKVLLCTYLTTELIYFTPLNLGLFLTP